MRTLSRRAILKLGAVATASLLASCTTKEEPTATPEQPTAVSTTVAELPTATAPQAVEEKIELRLGKFAGDQWRTDVVFSEKFTEENPNITVKVEDVNYSEMQTKVLAFGATGLVWDVYAGHSRWNAFLGLKGMSLVLDDYIAANDIEFDDFFPTVIDDVRSMGDDKIMWFPTCVHPAAIAMIGWNQDLLDKAGVTLPEGSSTGDWTIEEYTEILMKVCKPHELFGLNLGLWAPHGIAWLSRCWGSDPETGSEDAWPLSRDGKTNQVSNDFPRVKAAFEWYTDLVRQGIAPTTAENSAVSGSTLFQAGLQVSSPMGVSGPVNLNAQVGDKFKWVATQWPKGPYGHLGTCLSYNSLACYSESKYPAEAFKLAAYLTGPEPALYAGTQTELHAYGRRSAWFSPELWAVPGGETCLPIAAKMFDAGVDPFPMPWNRRFPELQDLYTNLGAAEYNEGKVSWDDMIEVAAPQFQACLDQERP